MNELSSFHLAIPVNDLTATRKFYTEILGCTVGREADRWIDFNFFGHQVSAHLKEEAVDVTLTNPVDGETVPVRHFGLVLEWESWQAMVKRLKDCSISFLIGPTIRFKGESGEQATFFITDPNGYALEFKSFKDMSQLFASNSSG